MHISKSFLVTVSVLSMASLQGWAQKITPTLQESVTVSSAQEKVKIQWKEKGNYQVFEGASPARIQWTTPIYVKNSKEITLDRKGSRPYYGIVNAQKDTLIVSERKMPFADVHNFRDIGGIKTKDGRYVSWGSFYRADALNDIADDEFTLFNDLGITRVYDLRATYEIEKEPDHLPSEAEYIHWPVFNEVNNAFFEEIQATMASGKFTEKDADALLLKANIDFVGEYQEKFKDLIADIFKENTPVVYHCSAGKDRTGYTSALLLAILNVDRETILQEYEMTNYYTQEGIEESLDKAAGFMGVPKTPEFKKAMYSLMGVKRMYLEAAFEVIDKQYGGMDAYIKNQLGVSDKQRKEIIQKYTYVK